MKPGDKVMLVWACCAFGRRHIGWIGLLEGVENWYSFCPACRHIHNGSHGVITIDVRGVVPLSWLRKMPDDPAEFDQVHDAEELVT